MATETKTKKHRSSQSTPDHYVLRVDLMGIQPSIWRRIHLDRRTRLDALHHILQTAMGWSDSHLHKFEIRGKHYGVPDPEFTDPGWEVHDEKMYRLNQLLAEGDTCDYLYDFGDIGRLNWNLNGTYTFENKFQATPVSENRDCVGYYSTSCGNIQPEITVSQRVTWSWEQLRGRRAGSRTSSARSCSRSRSRWRSG